MKIVLFMIGTVLLPIGLIGIPVPGVPGTPLVLLAGACYACSSPSTDRWLRRRFRTYGNFMNEWEATGYIAISRRSKALALSMMWLSIAWAATYHTQAVWLRICMVVVAVLVTWCIATRPNPQAAPIQEEGSHASM